MRKLLRLGIRILACVLLATFVYLINQVSVGPQKKNITNQQDRQIKIAKDVLPPSTTLRQLEIPVVSRRAVSGKDPNYVFDEADMLDEFGRKYLVIIWNGRHGVPGYKANPDVCHENISCEITYARDDVENAHAIIFPFGDHHPPPAIRKSRQHYVWWSLESPLHSSSGNYNEYNLTMHYRLDADVYSPYGSIHLILQQIEAANDYDIEALMTKKRKANKMAVWAVSNCYGKRMEYAKSLMHAGLDVDTFGGCFGGKQIGQGRYTDTFHDAVSSYKFYFSFENSITCKDYITEKFWFNGLRSGAVPIVWGPKKSDILKVAPTKSFIHASDFGSPDELVNYLNYLAKNETAYAEYLQWREWVIYPERIERRLRMEKRENDLRSFCKLCAILQNDGKLRKSGLTPKTRIIKSIRDSWMGVERNECHS